MPSITTTVLTDERTWQGEFYKALYGEDYTNYVSVDRSTDGYTDGILFEHKTNLQKFYLRSSIHLEVSHNMPYHLYSKEPTKKYLYVVM